MRVPQDVDCTRQESGEKSEHLQFSALALHIDTALFFGENYH